MKHLRSVKSKELQFKPQRMLIYSFLFGSFSVYFICMGKPFGHRFLLVYSNHLKKKTNQNFLRLYVSDRISLCKTHKPQMFKKSKWYWLTKDQSFVFFCIILQALNKDIDFLSKRFIAAHMQVLIFSSAPFLTLYLPGSQEDELELLLFCMML